MGNGKCGNEEMGRKHIVFHFSKQLTFCYCSHDHQKSIQWHSLRDHLCLTVGIKGVCKGIHGIMVCKLRSKGYILSMLRSSIRTLLLAAC